MNRYAMVLNGRVIDTVLSEKEPRYPPDVDGNGVAAILCNDSVVIGMGYRDGVFGEYVPEPVPEPKEPPLSEAEQTQLELALNVEYLTCLMELND